MTRGGTRRHLTAVATTMLALLAPAAGTPTWRATKPTTASDTSAELRRKPAVSAVVLQQQRESQRRGASPALQKDTVLIKQGPELDQLAYIVRQMLQDKPSWPSPWGW